MASPQEQTRPDRAKRFSASATLVAIVCATPVMAVMPGVPPLPRPAVATEVSGNRLVEASAPRVVKIVDSPAPSGSCAERTWPYYDSRCPGPAGAPAPAPVAPAPQTAVVTPLAPQASVAPPAAAPVARAPETVGTAARPDERAQPQSYSRTWNSDPETDAITAQRRDQRAAAPRGDERFARERGDDQWAQRGDERVAAGEDRDANYYEPVKPQKRRTNDGARRIHLGNFSIRF
jgi:hypothetical protein